MLQNVPVGCKAVLRKDGFCFDGHRVDEASKVVQEVNELMFLNQGVRCEIHSCACCFSHLCTDRLFEKGGHQFVQSAWLATHVRIGAVAKNLEEGLHVISVCNKERCHDVRERGRTEDATRVCNRYAFMKRPKP